MRNRSIYLLFVAMAGLAFLAGCQDEDEYSDVPEIKFVSLEKFDYTTPFDSLSLTFSFTDGDGDLGVASNDTATRDVIATMYEMKDGVFVPWDDGNPFLKYALPYMEPRGSNASLKGDISISMSFNLLQPNDTIKYDVYILDRAGNKSNTITTSTVITQVQ